MSEAPLHPRRIEAALQAITMERDEDEKVFDTAHVETFRAALKLLQKAQRGVGITADRADLIPHVLGVLDYVKKGLPHR